MLLPWAPADMSDLSSSTPEPPAEYYQVWPASTSTPGLLAWRLLERPPSRHHASLNAVGCQALSWLLGVGRCLGTSEAGLSCSTSSLQPRGLDTRCWELVLAGRQQVLLIMEQMARAKGPPLSVQRPAHARGLPGPVPSRLSSGNVSLLGRRTLGFPGCPPRYQNLRVPGPCQAAWFTESLHLSLDTHVTWMP